MHNSRIKVCAQISPDSTSGGVSSANATHRLSSSALVPSFSSLPYPLETVGHARSPAPLRFQWGSVSCDAAHTDWGPGFRGDKQYYQCSPKPSSLRSKAHLTLFNHII